MEGCSSAAISHYQKWISSHPTLSTPSITPSIPLSICPPPPHHFYPPPPHPLLLNTDEVRTIFISGLPDDVKERELQNMMRWLPGYEASQVNSKGDHPMGFALFSNSQLAISAKDVLQDMVFDSEVESILHVEMAKKNLFVKRGNAADSSPDHNKRLRTGGEFAHIGYSTPHHFHPAAPLWGPPVYLAPIPTPYDQYGSYPIAAVPVTPGPTTPAQNIRDNPPCNTLFIGNLGEDLEEEELTGVFSMQPGYRQMKVLKQERHTVCFIEFEDMNSAANAHRKMQGALIPSSGSVGMRIQYSKNPFGKRREAARGANGSSVLVYQ